MTGKQILVALMGVTCISLVFVLARGVIFMGKGPDKDPETGEVDPSEQKKYLETSNRLMQQRVMLQGVVLLLFFLILYIR